MDQNLEFLWFWKPSNLILTIFRESIMNLNLNDLLPIMVITLFVMGIFSFLIGVFVLISRTFGKDIRVLATQTNRLAQKGLMDGVAGLVGNASALLDATNQMVRTATGIGAFLTIIGLLLISASVIILLYFF
jgi:hypothetical protein